MLIENGRTRQAIDQALAEASSALERLRADDATLGAIEAAAEALIKAFESGGRAFSCGNGGSMSEAMHGKGASAPKKTRPAAADMEKKQREPDGRGEHARAPRPRHGQRRADREREKRNLAGERDRQEQPGLLSAGEGDAQDQPVDDQIDGGHCHQPRRVLPASPALLHGPRAGYSIE